MKKSLVWALAVLALTVVVLIMQGTSTMPLDFWFTEVTWLKSLVLLGFTAIGVIIGILLK